MEAESGRSLERFFDRWVLDTALPRVRLSTAVNGDTLAVNFTQTGEVFDVPLTVTVQYADGSSEDVVVPITEQTGTQVIRLKSALRSVDFNRDSAALGHFETK
jgi:aminopeptidase N